MNDKDPIKPCTCSPSAVTKYQNSGSERRHLRSPARPHRPKRSDDIEVPRVAFDKLSDRRVGEPSAAIQARVEAALKTQEQRLGG